MNLRVNSAQSSLFSNENEQTKMLRTKVKPLYATDFGAAYRGEMTDCLVEDPLAGSNTAGKVAEILGQLLLGMVVEKCLEASRFRFGGQPPRTP
jgi:hypothetical protein